MNKRDKNVYEFIAFLNTISNITETEKLSDMINSNCEFNLSMNNSSGQPEIEVTIDGQTASLAIVFTILSIKNKKFQSIMQMSSSLYQMYEEWDALDKGQMSEDLSDLN